MILVPASGEGPHLALDVSESPVQTHPRIPLVGLGATVVDWDLYPPDPDFVVLADTEGNRFCVIDTSHD